MKKIISIITDLDGKKIVLINDVRFALPVYNDLLERIDHYNIYRAVMLVRHSEDDKKYLYDFVLIKKETSSPPKS